MKTKLRLSSRGLALVTACAVMAAWGAAHAVPAWATAGQLSGVEGTTIGGPTNPQGLDSFGYDGYAVVYWGDGSSDTCQEATGGQLPQTESFCYWQLLNEFHGGVYGWHNYHFEGHYTVTIDQYDDSNNLIATDYGSASVAYAPLTPQTATSTTLVGAASSTVVGHFTDGDQYATDPHAYSALINWGDGTANDTNVTISGTGGSGGFSVSGTHTYAATSPAGGYAVTVYIADAPNILGFFDVPGTAIINSHVYASLSGAQSLTLQEGSPFSGVLAQFCGTAQPVTSATVNWGDGSTSDTHTTIQQGSNQGATCYKVLGTHTYALSAAQPYRTTITPNAGSGASAVTGAVTVTDAPLSSHIDANFLAGNSLSIPQSVIAHVKDANPLAPSCAPGAACDLSAQINWGDGSAVQTGTLTADPSGGVDVVGGPHQYPATGSYTVRVSVSDSGGASTVASAIYTVSPPPQTRLGCENPVPAVGATTGLYGARLPAGTHPNWGISADDRVLRFGNLVLCAADAPWVYDGPSTSAQLGGLGVTSSAGAFQTKGRVIINGLELDPHSDESAFTVDTSTGQITGPLEEVELSKEELSQYPDEAGRLASVDLRSSPWTLQGQTLAYLPATADAYADDFTLSGPLRVEVDGLGTVSVLGNAQLPDAFSLQAYAGGPVTGTVAFPDEYPGLLGGPVAAVRDRVGQGVLSIRSRIARPHRPELVARADSSSCNYPQAPADSPIDLTSDDLFLGGVDMRCAYLFANPSTGTAQGGAGYAIGSAYVNGYFAFDHGKFAYAGGGADGLNAEVFPGLTLNSIHFGVFLNPTRFHATSTFQVGEGLANLTGGALTVFATGSHKYSYDQDKPVTGTDDLPGTTSVIANPFSSTTIGIGAEYSPLGLFDVHGYVLYEYPGYIELGGHLGYDIGIVSADGNIQGQFWLPKSFDIEGNLSMCFVGLCSTARGLVSSRGLTGCWDVKVDYIVGSTTWSVGGAYRWGASTPNVYIPPFSSGCDDHLGDYRVTGASAASAAARARADVHAAAASPGKQTFHLGPGLHSVMVRVAGTGDAPAFTVSGPHGVQVATGAENTLAGSGTVGTYRSQQAATTWVAISHPGAGAWTITPQPGSVAITSVAVADYMPGASVHARVEGRGYHRTLRFTLRRRPGQTVRFVESGKGVTRSIATTSAPSGAIEFTPAIGSPGRRQIIAQVSRNGLLTAQDVVASYVAPGPPRAARPQHLELERHGSRLSISWAAAANATEGYQVVMIATDGRRQLFQRTSAQRSVIVPGFSSSGAKVTVEGVGPDGRTGFAASATLKPLGLPARIVGLKVTHRGKKGIQISWRPAARASAYLVTVTLTRVKRPALILTHKRVLRFVLKRSNIGVNVVVQGQGAMGALGPKARARLAANRPARKKKPKTSQH
jgi:hypothetical protein